MTIGVNPETGEIGGWYPLEAGIQLTTPEQREQARKYFEQKTANERRKGMRWVACYHDAIREITKGLSLTEAGAVIRLLPFLRFRSNNQLIKDGKPLKQADIQGIIGRGKRTVTTILNRLEEVGVLTKEENGRSHIYSLSMNFHTYGEVREENFTKLYQHHTNTLTKDLDLNEIGLLYKILPYFHYRTYHLCMNPNEPDETLLEHLDREDLGEVIGHEPDTVSKLVAQLRSKGIIMSTRSCDSVRYVVHPDVMFRQETEDARYADGIRKLFRQHLLERERRKKMRAKKKQNCNQ